VLPIKPEPPVTKILFFLVTIIPYLFKSRI
jgi:hypothetical protein